eukprot:4097404-Prymnesium_polylepis.1
MASLWLRGSELDWAFSAQPLDMPSAAMVCHEDNKRAPTRRAPWRATVTRERVAIGAPRSKRLAAISVCERRLRRGFSAGWSCGGAW